jgi:ADP-ribose pyrophosphatase YjhB (NUDIX family)
MAEIIKLAKRHRPQSKAIKRAKPPKREKGDKWSEFSTQPLSMPLANELAQSPQTPPPGPPGQEAVIESGVLAFRRGHNGETLILLISKRRSKKWGIPKGRVLPQLSFRENAAKEAFEEAGVTGHLSSTSVGMFRAKKSAANSLVDRIIEVWIYLLEVTETLPDWPEKDQRVTRWVTCETAARELREPLLTDLCHRLAQS